MFLLSLSVLGAVGPAGSTETVATVQVAPRLLVPPALGIAADRVLVRGSKYYLLDGGSHRVLVVNESRAIERQIGQIGQDKGAFFHPSDFGVDGEGRLYVLDNYSSRVQMFSAAGTVLSEYRITAHISGFAVTAHGHVLVGDPQSNALVAELGHDGRVVRRFGAMRTMSDFYGPQVRELDAAHRYAANRVALATDDADNVYVAFTNAPVFQKYDKNRQLVFERRLEGARAEKIFQRFRESRLSPARHGFAGDGASGPLIVTGIDVNERTGTIYVAFLWDDAYVYVADANGQPRGVLEGTKQPLRVSGVTVDAARSVLLAPRMAMVRQFRTYEIDLPSQLR
jgi:DNA-binding beta-propeller fold protein YncE